MVVTYSLLAIGDWHVCGLNLRLPGLIIEDIHILKLSQANAISLAFIRVHKTNPVFMDFTNLLD